MMDGQLTLFEMSEDKSSASSPVPVSIEDLSTSIPKDSTSGCTCSAIRLSHNLSSSLLREPQTP